MFRIYKRRLKRLSRLIYGKVKHLPWRTIDTPSAYNYNNTPEIDSPNIDINGQSWDLRFEKDGPTLTVKVRVNGETHFPGGEYIRFLPWAWEWRVFRRVLQDSTQIEVVPCNTAQTNVITVLQSSTTDGGLALIENKDSKHG